MEHVSATRTELLARRARIALAAQGRDLLQDKRAALMREFRRLSASVLEGMQALEQRASGARHMLAEAVALDGPEAIGSAAMAARADMEIELASRNVAGVHVVGIAKQAVGRPRTGRGYSLSATSARTDATAEGFEGVLDLLLDVVATELSLRRLAQEIGATTRRINVLEHVVIPRLEAERKQIAIVLEERELEERMRLRRARARRPRAAAPPAEVGA